MTTIAEALDEAVRSHREAVDALRLRLNPEEMKLLNVLTTQFLHVVVLARGLDVEVPF